MSNNKKQNKKENNKIFDDVHAIDTSEPKKKKIFNNVHDIDELNDIKAKRKYTMRKTSNTNNTNKSSAKKRKIDAKTNDAVVRKPMKPVKFASSKAISNYGKDMCLDCSFHINHIFNYAMSGLLLFVRLWMGEIFFNSGLVKIQDWSITLYMFKHEYNVPFLSNEFAAILATGTELTMPVLLVFGFMTRLASIPLLIMTLVIEIYYLQLIEHLYWSLLFLLIIFYGAGKFSIDYLICKKLHNKK